MDRGVWQATVHGLQRVEHDWAQTHQVMLCVHQLILYALT